VAGTAEASVRALSKVVQVMPPRLRRQVEALRTATDSARWGSTGPSGEDVDPVVLTTVAQACRDAERLELSYTAVDGARTERRVEPHRLVSLGRRWYLVAYDLGRQDWRSLRLDRLTAPRGDRSRFRPREVPGGDAAAFVQQRIRQFDATHEVTAVVHRPAAEVPRRIGRWVELTDLPGARCRLRMTTDSLDWAALALGTCGAELSEVGPPELVALLRDWAGRFSRADGSPGRV
jgi:predicted DNA-binding transcriptional regulator YafY